MIERVGVEAPCPCTLFPELGRVQVTFNFNNFSLLLNIRKRLHFYSKAVAAPL